MNRVKKIGMTLILFTLLTVIGFITVQVNAADPNFSINDGASIRTAGTQGLKFSATYDETFLNTFGASDTRGFFILYGQATIADLEAAEPNFTSLVNSKSIKQVSAYDDSSLTISVVLTGIPNTGYNQDITVIAFSNVDGVYEYSDAGVTRSVANVALKAANAGYSASVSSVLTEIENGYFKLGFDEFDNYRVSSPLYEYDRASLRAQFIEDWNALFGTTWSELVATDFYNSAKTGVTSSTDLSGSNIYNFFNDEDMNAKWEWVLTFIQNNDGTTHAGRQSVAIKGDGTNGTYALYNANHLSYSLANFFNKAHDSGGYASIDFTTTGGLAKYENVPTYNNAIYADYAAYSYVKTNDSVTIPDAPAKDYYTGAGYLDGSTPVSAGPGYIVSAIKKLVPQYTATPYTITYFDGATELNALADSYTTEDEVTLADYVKDGYVFDGWYDNSSFTGDVITEIPEGDHGNKTYYAKTTETAYVSVEVTYDFNGGQLNSTDLYTERDTDVKIVATRYSTAGDSEGKRITVGTSRGGAWWYVIGLKETSVEGIYEVVGKGTGYTDPEATLYVSYHGGCTSPYKAALVDQYNTTATVGSLVVIEWLPASVTGDTIIDMYFIAASEATDDLVVDMVESQDMLTPVRAGYTFDGWCDNPELTGTPITTYPGFVAADGVTEKTYYAKWTAE